MATATFRVIRSICVILMVAGIPALIVSSIAGNNEGWVVTFGMVTAAASLLLMVASAVASSRRVDAFNEVVAERVENRIRELVAAGADEGSVRELVRDALDLARGE